MLRNHELLPAGHDPTRRVAEPWRQARDFLGTVDTTEAVRGVHQLRPILEPPLERGGARLRVADVKQMTGHRGEQP